jgi:hypothetical protein
MGLKYEGISVMAEDLTFFSFGLSIYLLKYTPALSNV